MIASRYIPEELRPSYDEAISHALRYEIEGGGKDMVIGIENLDGNIYRIITTTGMGAYIHATHALLAIGLKDLLSNSLSGENGFDSRFTPTPEIIKAFQSTQITNTDAASEILALAPEFESLPSTERESIVKSRIGQGIFREKLVSYWNSCSVTGATCIQFLRASHIKPWRNSSNDERLDLFNGLLLAPNLDSVFDAGFISFDSQGKILLSEALSGASAYQLHISHKMKINSRLLTHQHRDFLDYHRTHIYVG